MNSSKNKKFTVTVLIAVLLLVSLYWIVGSQYNVYEYAATGALFELAWLPAILLMVALPVVSVIQWYKEHWKPNSIFLLIALLSLSLIVWLVVL